MATVKDMTGNGFRENDFDILAQTKWQCAVPASRGAAVAAVSAAYWVVDCGLGQTEATHALCPLIPAHRRVHYVQKGVGHYGVFNGSRFRSEIVPRINDFMISAATNKKPSLKVARAAAE